MSDLINQKTLADIYDVSAGSMNAIVKRLNQDGIKHFSRGGRVFTTVDAVNNALNYDENEQPNYGAMG